MGEVGACKGGGGLAANLSESPRISQNLSEALKIVDLDDKMDNVQKKAKFQRTRLIIGSIYLHATSFERDATCLQ
jgi:hypothetical protein